MRGLYRRTLRGGFALFGLYVLLASLSPLHLIERQELFPFFSWSLFSSPKSRVTLYSLLLETEPVETAEVPPAFETRDGYVRLLDSSLGRNIGLSKVLATYSHEASTHSHPADVFQRYRNQVDSVLRGHVVRYHLFQTVYDPIELFRERRYRETRYIATFDVAEKGD